MTAQAIKEIDSTRVTEAEQQGVPVIDVRPASMFASGHIPGAVNVPLVNPEDGSLYADTDVVSHIESAGVQPTDDVVLYCQTGYHAGLTADVLAKNGFENIELYSGSMNDWSAKHLPEDR